MLRVVTMAAVAVGLLVTAFDASAGDVVVRYYFDGPYQPEIVVIERDREIPDRVIQDRDIDDDLPYVTDYNAVPDYGRVYQRPASCGEYHYWDGYGCADARYTQPYLGPKW